MLDLHRATAPLVGPLERLSSDDHRYIPEEMQSYFRDVYDHAIRVNESVENFREMLNSVLGANLTQVTVRQNDDVRRISAWVAILAVPTMIAGHLRHELRAHAGAEVDARLPGRAAA